MKATPRELADVFAEEFGPFVKVYQFSFDQGLWSSDRVVRVLSRSGVWYLVAASVTFFPEAGEAEEGSVTVSTKVDIFPSESPRADAKAHIDAAMRRKLGEGP